MQEDSFVERRYEHVTAPSIANRAKWLIDQFEHERHFLFVHPEGRFTDIEIVRSVCQLKMQTVKLCKKVDGRSADSETKFLQVCPGFLSIDLSTFIPTSLSKTLNHAV